MTHLAHLRRIKSRDSSHYLFERQSVEACDSNWSHMVTLEELPAILGCSIGQVQQLLAVGFLFTEKPLSADAISVRYPLALLTAILYQCRHNQVRETMIPILEAAEQGHLDLIEFLTKVLSRAEIVYTSTTDGSFGLNHLYLPRRQLKI